MKRGSKKTERIRKEKEDGEEKRNVQRRRRDVVLKDIELFRVL